MSGLPFCPKCNCEYTYENGSQFVCQECDHEWSGIAVSFRIMQDCRHMCDLAATCLTAG